MKKLRNAVAALVIAAGAFGAYAFSNANNEIKSAETTLHWFDEDGNYLGPNTIAEQDAECPGTGNVCAIGYVGENNGQPVGQPQYTAERN